MFFSHGYPQPKVLQNQGLSGKGCLKFFLVNGKKTLDPYRVKPFASEPRAAQKKQSGKNSKTVIINNK